ncbi:Predicted transcriptional regulator [Granulicella rosea]|uniref:Predicted transcriptional regulator n=1 Tax=Granulicella rosea TaxID=474952 RepID=A0A239KN68_9BACT|nr:BlaI/MecI/CopY family transcriptional regulator [Granulicella rosea]SNT19470.1 Predicted transcriptional regulator [Granulicella rosea]
MKNLHVVPRPTESELELLTILWQRREATVRELYEAVNAGRPVVYTGVLKLLQIMAEKGLVSRDETERAHVYRAAVSQADTEHRLLRELSERFFAGSAAQLALRALEMEKASDEELDAIRRLLKKKSAR